MKKILQKTISVLIISNLFFGWSESAAQDVGNFYVNMPDKLNPTLSKQNRHELLEYYKAGQTDSITNRYGNHVSLNSVDTLNQILLVKNTPVSSFEMKVFNLNNDSLAIGIIRTICGTVCQSSVEFYDTAWNKIPLIFTMPKAIDWVNKDSLAVKNVDKQWVENVLENNFISLSFATNARQIVAKNNSAEFMSAADRKIISPLLEEKKLIFQLEDRKWIVKP